MSLLVQLSGFATQINTNVLPHTPANGDELQLILNTFFSILAAVALLVIVIAGLRYVNAAGDPNTMSRMKNTVIYAVVGLVVSMIAFAVVTFVINNL